MYFTSECFYLERGESEKDETFKLGKRGIHLGVDSLILITKSNVMGDL